MWYIQYYEKLRTDLQWRKDYFISFAHTLNIVNPLGVFVAHNGTKREWRKTFHWLSLIDVSW